MSHDENPAKRKWPIVGLVAIVAVMVAIACTQKQARFQLACWQINRIGGHVGIRDGRASLWLFECESVKGSIFLISWIDNAYPVETVCVDNSDIDDRSIYQLSRLKNLEDLYASETRISDAALAFLADHPSLKRIHVSSTAISDEGLCNLRGLEKLESFHARNSKVRLDDPKGCESICENLSHVDDLDFAGCRLDAGGLATIAKLPRLRWLSISNGSITRTLAQGIFDGRTLEVLCAEDCQIEAGSLGILAASGTIEVLTLDGSNISDQDMETIARLPKLRVVSVGRTVISGNGLAKLRDTPVETIHAGGCLTIADPTAVFAGFRSLGGVDVTSDFEVRTAQSPDVKNLQGEQVYFRLYPPRRFP